MSCRCPFPSLQRIDLEEATEHRDAARETRIRRILALRGEGLSISTIVERTGYGRTFVVDVLAGARDAVDEVVL